MKNVRATVHAVAVQTLRYAEVTGSVQETLDSRLVALAGSHDLLTRGGWEGACLTDVVQRALAPYEGSGRVRVEGPPATPSKHEGFGSWLLEHGLAPKVGGTVKLDFHPEGLGCRICLPVTTED